MDLNFSSRRSLLEPDKRQKNVNNLFRTQKRRKIMSHMSFIIGFVIFMTNGLLVFVLLQCWLATHQQMNAFENIHFFSFRSYYCITISNHDSRRLFSTIRSLVRYSEHVFAEATRLLNTANHDGNAVPTWALDCSPTRMMSRVASWMGMSEMNKPRLVSASSPSTSGDARNSRQSDS